LAARRYPWGNQITHDNANYQGTAGKDQWSKCAPVGGLQAGSFAPNDYGLYDMAGNVAEWCNDWYDGNYYDNAPAKNPPGPDTGPSRLLRGGTWDEPAKLLRLANRSSASPNARYRDAGFRCAVDSVPTDPDPDPDPDPDDSPDPDPGPDPEVTLIPAGWFEMGDHLDEMKKALPVHTVELDAFYMNVNEVTVGQFKQFVDQSDYEWWPDNDDRWSIVAKYSPTDDHPMVYVSWHDATAYADWAGKRLPTEAEWEYAARGGLAGKRYLWGDEITHNRANHYGIGGKDKWPKSAPVGSFAPNDYGLYDMAGNVAEWCRDWYDGNYYNQAPPQNPPGATEGSRRVLRGGSWMNTSRALRVANRSSARPETRYSDIGFRCVSESESRPTGPPEPAPPVSMKFSPIESVSVNQSFTVQVLMNRITNLAGWSFNLEYDPTILSLESVEEGNLLRVGDGTTFFQNGTVNEKEGTVTGLSSTYLGTGGVSNSGNLLTINLKPIRGGSGYLRLKETKFGDSKGQEIPIQVINTTVTVIAEHVPAPVPSVPSCDVNANGTVDIFDLILVAQLLGQESKTRADTNGDGSVNIFDMIIVAQCFGHGAAPSIVQQPVATFFMVENWIHLAENVDDGSEGFSQGISMLREILRSLKPEETVLMANYPNPFNPETWIAYHLSQDSAVVIRIYDTTGKIVRTLDMGLQTFGYYAGRDKSAHWDGRTDGGELASSGTYFYQIQAGDYQATRKMVILK
jgi:formylglycine-generating enzyme required for sulfatase activity